MCVSGAIIKYWSCYGMEGMKGAAGVNKKIDNTL